MSCKNENPGRVVNTDDGVDIANVVQANFKNDYTNGVSVQVSEDRVAISSTGLPDHKTQYWREGLSNLVRSILIVIIHNRFNYF